MNKLTTINDLWNDLKLNNINSKITIETADKVIEIIRKITNARKNLNMTQRELAKKCGIKQPELARIETFKNIPRINTLIKIASCVNIHIEALNEQQKNEIIKAQQIAYLVVSCNYANSINGGYEYVN